MQYPGFSRPLRFFALLSGLIGHLWAPRVLAQYDQYKYAEARNGMVISAHPEASRIGREILLAGGTAFDAAVGVELALAVCFPVAGNIGGGGFSVIRTAKGEVFSIDYREQAPLRAHERLYQNAAGQVNDSLARMGALAVGVPGTPAGMQLLHQKLGTINLNQIMAPIIKMARQGFVLTAIDAQLLNDYKQKFKSVNKRPVPFVREDRPWKKGDTLRQPELARTLSAMSSGLVNGFYKGWVADSIAAEMARHGGLIRNEDLQSYSPKSRPVLSRPFKSPIDGKTYKLYSMAPPSSGGIILHQVLGMMQNIKPDVWRKNRNNQVWRIQQLVEAERLAYADRSRYLGDPDFVNVPVDRLLAPDYLKARYKAPYTANAVKSETVTPGLGAFDKKRDMKQTIGLDESEETTHYTVVDRWGNAVSNTTTQNGAFGSYLVVGGTGILLNNQMDDFSAKPGSYNSYNLLGATANAIQPGKRMLSSMTPTIITEVLPAKKNQQPEEKLFMTVGTPGGSTIPTSVIQTILNVLIDGQTPDQAVAKPRYHHQWMPDVIYHEPDAFDEVTKAALTAKGYELKERNMIGRVEAIILRPDGMITGGADPRGDDTCGFIK